MGAKSKMLKKLKDKALALAFASRLPVWETQLFLSSIIY